MILFFTFIFFAMSQLFASATPDPPREFAEPLVKRFRRELEYVRSPPIISAQNTGAGINSFGCQDNLIDSRRNLKVDQFTANSVPAILMVELLKKFSRSCIQKPERVDGLEDYIRVIKIELFTLTTSNHLVLPIVDDTTERVLYEKMITFSTDWYNISRAEGLNDQLLQELRAGRDRYLSLGQNISVHEFKTLLPNYQSGMFHHPIGSSQPKNNKVFFPLQSLFADKLDVNDTALADWLNDFNVRKYLIHEEVLSRSGKSPSLFSQSYDPEISAILELAKSRVQISCIYIRLLNEFSAQFEAKGFPKKLMDPFKEGLLNAIKVLDPTSLPLIEERRKQFDESLRRNSTPKP